MTRAAAGAIAAICGSLIGLALSSLPEWVWRPLVGKGYQLWSGIASDVSEVTLVLGLITGAVAVRQFLHQHFECHAEGCHKLGFHRVEGTHFRTCWNDHPVLGQHPRHSVPLPHIHREHRDARAAARTLGP